MGMTMTKHTIALVDDDRNILTSVAMALEAEGFEVRTYGDGEEALRGLTSRPVSLAVLDIKMPRMDGMELLSRLRQNSSIPVIFRHRRMTSWTSCSACAWALTTTSPSRFPSAC